MNKVNWGIIGLGNITKTFAEALNNVDNALIKGVASKNENNLKLYRHGETQYSMTI